MPLEASKGIATSIQLKYNTFTKFFVDEDKPKEPLYENDPMIIRQPSPSFTTPGEQLINYHQQDPASVTNLDEQIKSSSSVKGPIIMPQMPSMSLPPSSLPCGTHQMPTAAVAFSTLSVALPPQIPKVGFILCRLF